MIWNDSVIQSIGNPTSDNDKDGNINDDKLKRTTFKMVNV